MHAQSSFHCLAKVSSVHLPTIFPQCMASDCKRIPKVFSVKLGRTRVAIPVGRLGMRRHCSSHSVSAEIYWRKLSSSPAAERLIVMQVSLNSFGSALVTSSLKYLNMPVILELDPPSPMLTRQGE